MKRVSTSPGGTRVALVAPGLGHVWRGYESAMLEAADALRDVLDVRIYGARSFQYRGIHVRGLASAERGWLGERLRIPSIWAYRIEQLTFSLALASALAVDPPDIVHVCDRGVAKTLTRLRDAARLPYQIVFCNGGNYGPDDVGRFYFTQLVTPLQWDTMLRAGLPPTRLAMIPHGLHCTQFRDPAISRAIAGRSFGIPDDVQVVLTVTPWDFTKKLDYLVYELARLADPSIFLVIAGQPTAREPDVRRLTEATLANRHILITPERSRMPALYRAADIVAQCRLDEGLPMAYLEAMAAERPLIVHDWALSRWLVPADRSRVDMTVRGALGERLSELLHRPDLAQVVVERNAVHVRETFDWAALRPRYLEMYERVLQLKSQPWRPTSAALDRPLARRWFQDVDRASIRYESR